MSELNDDTHNVTLYDEAGNPVAVILDGATYRLAVDAKITGGEIDVSVTISRFRPRLNATTTKLVGLSQTVDTSVFSFTGTGRVDFISLAFSKPQGNVILKVDGTEIYRLNLDDLVNIHRLDSSSSGDLEPMYSKIAGKFFRDIYYESGDFASSFEVLVRAGSPDTNLNSHLIKFREKV